MKAILEFDLPDEKDEYEMYKSTRELHLALWQFQEELRNICKYDQEGYDIDTVEKIRDRLFELLDMNNIILDR